MELNKSGYKLIKLNIRETDGMGSLGFFEELKDLSFSIKRIYYIFDVKKGIQRGGHAHKKLKQMLFCPYGSIEIILDDSKTKTSIMLDDPSVGLELDSCLWRDMIWHRDDSVLCVAASEYYDENDYIRDYGEFVAYCNQLNKKI